MVELGIVLAAVVFVVLLFAGASVAATRSTVGVSGREPPGLRRPAPPQPSPRNCLCYRDHVRISCYCGQYSHEPQT